MSAHRIVTKALHWFPMYSEKWLGSSAISGMLPEQEGAFVRLLNLMWLAAATEEPSLPNDDAQLARMSRLGARWKRLGPAVKAQFEESNGRLFNHPLSVVWHEQQKRYNRRAEAGKRSGKARAIRKQSTNNVPTKSEHAPIDMVLRGDRDPLSRGAGALAPSEARPAEPRRSRGELVPISAVLAGVKQ